MNALVVFYSQYGNTKQIAEAIGETFLSGGSVRTIRADALTAADLDDVDLLVAGTPTHVGNLPKAVRPILDDLPKRALKGAQFAAFDTSYRMKGFASKFTAAKPLGRRLRKLGGKRFIRPETFFVAGREGPLYEGEIERAKDWAKMILAQIGSGA